MIVTVDFETEAIESRPKYPPKPVGVAIKFGAAQAQYYAWGHPTGNNTTREKARDRLLAIYKSSDKVLFHNAKFDLDVGEQHLNLPPLPWDRVHDTMFTLFLRDPHANSLSLKPAAERWLGLPPDERDAVGQWLVAKGIIKSNQRPGAFISRAPGALVGRYAIGDVDRTYKLHMLLHPQIVRMGMREAYDVERQLLPILLDNERRGMRVDLDGLHSDLEIFEIALAKIDNWLRRRLGNKTLNLDADAEVADALRAAGVVSVFPKTATGKDSVSKKNLTIEYFADRDVFYGLYYRNALATVLTMSMRPWLEQGSACNGYIFTDWNQVRTSHGFDNFQGARSGRITCSYFQNISKDFLDRGDDYGQTGDERIRKLVGLPALPLVRKYLLPDKGDLWLHRDYNQQEMRILAHYECGALAQAYQTNPAMDVHDFVQGLMQKATGRLYPRREVKIVDFQTVYGGGATALMNKLRCSRKAAEELRAAWKAALPDVVSLDRECKQRFQEGGTIRTFGGRVYHCKPDSVSKKGPRKGELINYAYTGLNYLIQPSAADVTKRAIIAYHNHPARRARLIVTVHDELNSSSPPQRADAESQILKECMESVRLDVPWKSDGKRGPNWGTLKKETPS
jgi:DNA polymerase I-like protein with 3'-5' exonuclease and polymerase domains